MRHDPQPFLRGGYVNNRFFLGEEHQGWPHGWVIDKITVGTAARYLHINNPLAQMIFGNQPLFHRDQLGQRQRQRHRQLAEAAFQAAQMAVIIDQLAVHHGAYLINRIRHQKAAIENRDRRSLFRQELPVYIHHSTHHLFTSRCLEELPKRRSMIPATNAIAAGITQPS